MAAQTLSLGLRSGDLGGCGTVSSRGNPSLRGGFEVSLLQCEAKCRRMLPAEQVGSASLAAVMACFMKIMKINI